MEEKLENLSSPVFFGLDTEQSCVTKKTPYVAAFPHQSSQQYLQDVKDYLDDEYYDTHDCQPLPGRWRLCHDSVPQQHNGNDCGVFTSTFAEELLLQEDLEFQLQNVNQYRRKMTAFVQV